MHAKTDEFLNFLLYSADMLTRPTFRNLTDSYETWADRKGLLRRVVTLQKRRLIERDSPSREERLYRLTEQGRLRALGGRDPAVQWARDWDGCWRMVVFDVPIGQNARRESLRRHLRSRAFGCLQQSVWITPDIVQSEQDFLAGNTFPPNRLLLLEARPCAEEKHAEIVSAAWDFDRINRRFERYLELLKHFPSGALRSDVSARKFRGWAAEERVGWLDAISIDPLLPTRLLPVGYLGFEAWRQKTEVLRRAAEESQRYSRC